jgi:hypothetical protein
MTSSDLVRLNALRTFLKVDLRSIVTPPAVSLFLLLTFTIAVYAQSPQSAAGRIDARNPAVKTAKVLPREPLRFVQITDVHLFDEGKKRDSEEEYDRDQKDNREALRWTVDEVNQLISRGRVLDFVLFTGDFGLELVRAMEGEVPCNLSDRDKQDFGRYKQQGWPRFVPMRDAANEVAHEFGRLQVRFIYILPGNNDLVGEKPCDRGRYTEFVRQVAGAMPGNRAQVVDLLDPGAAPVEWKGFRLVGLNSASFKSASDLDDASAQLRLLDQSTQPNLQDSSYLIFTHIPDLEDPYSHKPSWDAAIVRDKWREIARRPEVAAIFAGHFHSSERLLYGVPGLKPSFPDDEDIADKTWVAPPLAVKAQDDKSQTARGFLVVQLQKSFTGAPYAVNASVAPYWYERARQATCSCHLVAVLSGVAVLVFLIGVVYVYARTLERYEQRVLAYPTLLTVFGLAAIGLGTWEVMKFMTVHLQLPAMYWVGPIFGAIGGIFGGLGDGNAFTLAWYEGAKKIHAGILGDVLSGLGGSVAVEFVAERTLRLQPGDSDSLLLLMSTSFIAGVAGRKVVQIALDRFHKSQEPKRPE